MLTPFKGRCVHCGHDHDSIPIIFKEYAEKCQEIKRQKALFLAANTEIQLLSETIVSQQAEIERLNARIKDCETIINTDAEDEAITRNELKMFLTPLEAEGDSYGVPAISDAVMLLIQKHEHILARVKELEEYEYMYKELCK